MVFCIVRGVLAVFGMMALAFAIIGACANVFGERNYENVPVGGVLSYPSQNEAFVGEGGVNNGDLYLGEPERLDDRNSQ